MLKLQQTQYQSETRIKSKALESVQRILNIVKLYSI
jgi:hypothetical protein